MPDNIVNIDFHRHFRIEPGERVLDLGCGNGRHTIEAARYPGRVVGLDFSRDDLVAAKFMYDDLKRKGQAQGVADFIVGDAENLPFKDSAFDRSICTEVFEHIPDDERGIDEFLRVTKPGAPVAVSVPHYWPETLFWKLSWDYWHTPGGHVRRYRPGQMRKMLEQRDMEVRVQRSRHSFQSLYWFLRCTFGTNNENVLPVRTFFRFINWHHARRPKPLEYIEATANLVIGKDMILYGRKRLPGERRAAQTTPAAATQRGGAMTMTLDRFQSIDPALLDIDATDRVIDLGCGTGRHVLELSKAPANVIGADLSSHDLRVGRYLLEIMRRRGEVKSRVHWMQAAGERLPFIDGAFDRVICTETLEHVDDDGALARELVRVLKPGGILAISVPDEYSERLFWKLSENYRTHVGGHVRVYGRRQIVDLLKGAGLRPYAVRYRHSLETLYWLSHVAFWSEWGKQGPITRVFRRALDSERSRRSPIVTAIDDIGNRILPKSIVLYSRKPLRPAGADAAEGETLAPVTLEDETPHVFGTPEHIAPEFAEEGAQEPSPDFAETAYREALEAAGELPGANGHAGPREAEDDRTTVEVRAVPAPFAVEPPPVRPAPEAARAALSLRDELRIAMTLEGETQKERLVEILRSCRFRLMGEVQDLSGEQASSPWTEDGRSLKEIVGHITGWERWVTAGLEEIVAGETEPGIMSLSGYPIGIARYASIEAFNAARMAEARETMWSAVLAESDATFERLIARVEEVPASMLAATSPFFWPDLGGTVPCGVYLLMVSAHHYQEEHLSDVLR